MVMNNMYRILSFILIFVQISFSGGLFQNDSFVLNSSQFDIELLLDYESKAKKIKNEVDKASFYSETSFSIYQETLNLENRTKNILGQYTALINSLEERLNINHTSISYDLGSPIIDYNFKYLPIDRRNIKNKTHFNQVNMIKEQYLRLSRYSDKIINICEKRIDELLLLLDETSIDRLYNKSDLKKHIVVMNFSNLSNNKKYDKFISAFSDIIINRYKQRDDISVMHSGSIEPDLRDVVYGEDNTRLLIDGSFMIDGYDININFKVYDVNDWSLKSNKSLSCDIRDIDCIYDDFLWSIKNSIDPLISNQTYDDFSDDDKKVVKKENFIDSPLSRNDSSLFSVLLEDFVIQKDYSFDISYKDMGINDEFNLESQSFDLSSYPKGIQNKQDLSKSLINLLKDFSLNPYNIDIGKLDMMQNQYDNAYIDLSIPVIYSIKTNDLKRSIKKLPYNTLNSKEDIYVIEFLYDDYLFSRSSINSLNNHQDELFPVLFFADKNGNIQKIVIDSWDSKYDNLLFGDYDVSRVNLFSSLFTIMESNKNMNLHIDSNKRKIDYKVTMPVSVLDNYTRLTVKIFTRKDLDDYLPVSELKF